jgi:aminoglycoside phosphotransferase (APT) family kinase protein
MRAVVDVADVAPYLAEHGLLDARAVVDGGLRVEDLSRKNRVFLVTAEGAPCYVVKAPSEPGDGGVAREAAVLKCLVEPRQFLPRCVMYDEAAQVLVLETPPGARDLAQQYDRGRFSLILARQTGKALAAVHSTSPRSLDGVDPVDPRRLLAVHRLDLETMGTLTAAGLELVRLVQGSADLCEGLDQLLSEPVRDGVVHGDLRWDNVLVVGRGGSRRRTRALLVDWELAAAGDPALDIGAYLAEYLRFWKRHAGMPEPGRAGNRLYAPARALPHMQPTVAAFWEAYVRSRALPADELSPTLQRALRFAGARLVLAALEETQTLSELKYSLRMTLQLGANVMQRPDEAADRLLGLPTDREAS